MAETITNPPFTSVNNFRDVGKVINTLTEWPLLRENTFYRSGRLDDATSEDRKKLISEYSLRTVVDLRTPSEHILQAKLHAELERATEAGKDPLVDDWKTVKINFISRKFQMNMLWQLRWYHLISFIILLVLRYRFAAIRILGKNVMGPRGLVGLSEDSMEYCQSEILQALEVMTEPKAYPMLIHCTQGKDRSGLIVMLVLFLLRVPKDLIKADYMLSNQGLDRVRASLLKEVYEIGMSESYTRAPEEVVDGVWRFLENRGGIDAYLDQIGFDESKRTALRDRLLV